jgi:hypothetical protein
MASLEDYLLAKAKMDEARRSIVEIGRQAFDDGAKSLFEAHPVLKSFGWNQYTPYFNDGDACTFSAETDYPKIAFTSATESEDDDDEEDDECDEWSSYNARKKQEAGETLTAEESAGLAVLQFLQLFDDDTYEEMFEDHMSVTVTRDGTTTEEYSHD